MKKQVVVIHGGWSFNKHEDFINFLRNRELDLDYFLHKKGWKGELGAALGDNYEVLTPQMPNKQNAKYEEWKIWIERMTPFLRSSVVFVGHSLGALFLAKYLSENIFPKKIGALFLVAAPWRDTVGIANFPLVEDLQKVWAQCSNIHIYQSEDDPLVALSEAKEYQLAWPGAKMHLFTDRGHFNQEEFPELVREIKNTNQPINN